MEFSFVQKGEGVMIYRKAGTYLAQTLDEVERGKAMCDDYAKCILADPQILANIIKTIIPQFGDMSIDEIIPCIGETVVTLRVPELLFRKVENTGTEDIDEEDGKIIYDIKFPLYYKNKEMKIIVNVEAQKSTQPSKLGYHLENRITYYMCRMISSQKNIEFFHSNYDDIKNVYSIWICMDTNIKEDSILKFSMNTEQIFGETTWNPPMDLVNGAVIRIRSGNSKEESRNKLIAMLELLFSKTETKKKKQELEQNFNLKMSTQLEGCVETMCNISDYFEEVAMERGWQKGMEKGMQQGIQQGMQKGECMQLIRQVIAKLRKHMTVEETAEMLEQSEDTIRRIYEIAEKMAPDYDADQILEQLLPSFECTAEEITYR